MVIWLIGLAGAGKTSLGERLHRRLKARNPATLFIDGDALRRIVGDDLGHTLEARRANGWRLCRLCEYLDAQGIDVVCGVLSLFHDQQAWNRERLGRYFEIYVEVPFETLVARNQKGLYREALAGRRRDVAGVDIPFEPPPRADLVIRNDGPPESLDGHVETIVAALAERGWS